MKHQPYKAIFFFIDRLVRYTKRSNILMTIKLSTTNSVNKNTATQSTLGSHIGTWLQLRGRLASSGLQRWDYFSSSSSSSSESERERARARDPQDSVSVQEECNPRDWRTSVRLCKQTLNLQVQKWWRFHILRRPPAHSVKCGGVKGKRGELVGPQGNGLSFKWSSGYMWILWVAGLQVSRVHRPEPSGPVASLTCTRVPQDRKVLISRQKNTALSLSLSLGNKLKQEFLDILCPFATRILSYNQMFSF